VAHFDRLAGTDGLRLGIEGGSDIGALSSGWGSQAGGFESTATAYHLYPR
jgi:hypothetical protein